MRATIRPLIWSFASAAVLSLPVAVRAQQPLDPFRVSPATTVEADKLDARAAEYEAAGSVKKWGKAAGLRERAAGMRAPEDPRGFSSLQTAAFLRYALEQRSDASRLMERAGDQAMARGDVFNAATSYVNTAIIAIELKDADRARQFVTRGELLMHSPLLSEEQRTTLHQSVAQASDKVAGVALAMH